MPDTSIAEGGPVTVPIGTLPDDLVRGDKTYLIATEETQIHAGLARHCLQLLNKPGTLFKDLCRIGRPGVRREEIDRESITESIASDVAYACQHWMLHLISVSALTGEILNDNEEVHDFLKRHFLHWLEALAWLDKFSCAVDQIYHLRRVVRIMDKGEQLLAFLDDAHRFLLRHRQLIDVAPLQIYSSALYWTPLQSVIRTLFLDIGTTQFSLIPKPPHDWGLEIWRREGPCGLSTVAMSPDGKIVASAGWDEVIRLQDACTGGEILAFEREKDAIRMIAFSPDGTVIASLIWDQRIQFWNARTGEKLKAIIGHDDKIVALQFSPDGKSMASGSCDKTVRLWDLRIRREIKRFEGHTCVVTAVDFSPDGVLLASSSTDFTVRLWDIKTGEQVNSLEGHFDYVYGIGFSPNGEFVASASNDRTIRLWNVHAGGEVLKLVGHDADVNFVAFSPDGVLIASSSDDMTVRLWEGATGIPKKIEGHQDCVTALAFAPDGKSIVSVSSDRTIRQWLVDPKAAAEQVEKHNEGVKLLVMSPNGEIIVSTSHDRTVRVWSTNTGEVIRTLELHGHSAWRAAFSPDSRHIAYSSGDDTIRLLDIVSGEILRKLEGHSDTVRGMNFSPDGKAIASRSLDLTVRLWDLSTGEESHKLTEHTASVNAVAFSPHGRLMASASDDHTARLWNLKTGEKILQLDHEDRVEAVLFSSDGETLASTCHKTIHLWNLLDGVELQRFESDYYGMNGLAFSPGGEVLASAPAGHVIEFWNVQTGKLMTQHTTICRPDELKFNHDGSILHTDIGTFNTGLDVSASGVQVAPKSILEFSDIWLQHKGEDVLWLPVEYRDPACYVGFERTLVLGFTSGIVAIFRLST